MANVLKSDSFTEKSAAARSVSGLAGFNLNDLADEGRSRLDQCRTQVRQMIDEATKQGEQIQKKAAEDGYQEGLKRAAVDAETKLQNAAELRAKEAVQVLSQAVQQMHQEYESWMQQYSQTLNSIALAAAQRIVRKKLDNEPEILVRWAEEALTSTRSATRLTLAVHPETIAQLGEALDLMLVSPGLPEQTHVEPDETLPRDSVVVRQLGGDIDAGLEMQLKRLETMLS
ncbi:FliH/SctL family protein [Rubripirellula reticaptiva]|uniref:Flagellar assembly protein FliH n=1 Tax=Rubripirellula reticaptiva TaxID=2528013 RepID=A0A5C6FAI9_9BACT|nr:FliH/SctL family protein [Rubripirellula reticaptiva]TWU57517.1 flagellar assembly protein H [Rubripirellula reticaptiva]